MKSASILRKGVIVTLLVLMLLIFPGLMSSLWPWKVTPLLAQMYAGPLLSYGGGSVVLSVVTARALRRGE